MNEHAKADACTITSRCSRPGWRRALAQPLRRRTPLLKVAPKTLRLAAEAGEIEARRPLPDGPWIFARAALATDAAKSIVERLRLNAKYPAGPDRGQQSLFPSMT